MFTATQAKEVTNSNKFKVDSVRDLLLSYVISRIKQTANKGLSNLELKIDNTNSRDVNYSDYSNCVYNLRLTEYKVRHLKSTIYISW